MWDVITGNAPACMGIEKRQYKVIYIMRLQELIWGFWIYIYCSQGMGDTWHVTGGKVLNDNLVQLFWVLAPILFFQLSFYRLI